MAPLPSVPNVVKVVISYTYGDKAAENVLHFQYAGGGAASESFLTAIVNGANTVLSTLAPIWGPDVTWDQVSALDLSSDTGLMAVFENATVGTRAGTTLPANAAVLASYTVARRYRGGHARTYLPWLTAADLETPQTWASTIPGEVGLAWSAVLNAIKAAAVDGFTIVNQVQIGYRPVGPVPKTSVVVDAIVPSIIQLEVASMRRRDGRH